MVQPENRDVALDIIKILSTIFVIKLHCGTNGLISEVLHYICGIAIPLFLMVSGALILSKKNVDYKYAAKKALNVCIIIALWSLVLTAGKFVTARKFENPLKYVIGAFNQEGMLSHFWYLLMLLLLYLLCPILSRLSKNGNSIAWTTVVLIALCGIMSTLTLFMGKRGIEARIPQVLRLWTHVTYFWLGGISYQYLRLKNRAILPGQAVAFTGIGVVMCISMSILQYKILEKVVMIHSPEYLFSNPIVICYNVTMFSLMVILLFPISSTKKEFWTTGLSMASFGAYILHMFVIVAIDKIVPGISWALKFVAVVVISFVVSCIVGKIPFIRRFLRF